MNLARLGVLVAGADPAKIAQVVVAHVPKAEDDN